MMQRLGLLVGFVVTAALLGGCGGSGSTGSNAPPPASGGSTIRGRAVTQQGSPVQGATVLLQSVGGKARGGGQQTTTDVNGNFTFTNVPAGTYTVTVDSSVNGQTTTVVVTVTVPVSATIDLTVRITTTSATGPGAGTIAGRVMDSATGDGVAGAQVTAEILPPGSSEQLKTFTDANGDYRFDSVLEGTWILTASMKHFSSSTVQAVVLSGATSQVDITIREKPGGD